jgi:predicted Ser/Thr protein kinase
VLDTKTQQKMALKLEKRTSEVPMLFYEAKILKYLKNTKKVPGVICWGYTGDFNYMGMEILGSSLERMLQL